MIRQIIAAGGDALGDIALHHYILAQSTKRTPKICLLPTASADSSGVIKGFFEVFNKHRCEPDFLPLFYNKEENIREFLLSQDIILVAGGQSKSMMGVWKEWGIDEILRDAYDNGTILSGGSAGSVCWFDECITDSFGKKLQPMKCMGYLPYSNCPHYRSEERRTAYKAAILSRTIAPGYAVSDGAAIHFKDNKFFTAVSSIKEASSFYVDIDSSGKEEKIKSERLVNNWLHDKDFQDEAIWSSAAFRD